jgi:hypothetical protein
VGLPLTVQGNLNLESGAELTTIARGASPSDIAKLVVNGNATIGGKLSLSLANGFIPARGNRFHVIESGTISGAFAENTFPSLPTTTGYYIQYHPGFAEVVVGESSYADWKKFHFGQVTDPAIAGVSADPDGDGILNLQEYAFGLDPLNSSRAGLPLVSLQQFPLNGPWYLTLTYTTPDTIADLEFIPEVSSNMLTWQSASGSTVVVSDTVAGGMHTVVVRDSVAVADAKRRFIHLQVRLRPSP